MIWYKARTLTVALVFGLSISLAQERYTLPMPQVLVDSGVTQIDVFVQHINDLDQWNNRMKFDDSDQLVGEDVLIARYHLNASGNVDSMIQWDTTSKRLLRIRIDYDDAGRYASIHYDDSTGLGATKRIYSYTSNGISYELWKKDGWKRKLQTDIDTILLVDHIRNGRDSGYYCYDPLLEKVTNTAFRDRDLAYRNELRYLMKDGRPDSLYIRNEYLLPAFDTYLLQGVPKLLEGKVDVLPNGEAVVPKYNPLHAAIKSGYAFGDHRTKTRIPFFEYEKVFQEDSLLDTTSIWPEFLPSGVIERSFYVIYYTVD